MKITIFTVGSRGDVQPCVALSRGLRHAGYDVSLATSEDFADFVHQYDLEFSPLRGSARQMMESQAGRAFMETGNNKPIQSIFAIRKLTHSIVLNMAQDAYEACRTSDAIICLGVLGAFGQSIAESLDIPIIYIEPTPLLPTREFAAPSWPIQRNLGGLHNYASGIAMLHVVWHWFSPFINEFRQKLGLSPYSASMFIRSLKSMPMLGAYSSQIISHPEDWSDNVKITGYFFLNSQLDWQPSPDLQRFLEAGAPPVYVGFGSMSGLKPEQLTTIVTEALNRNNQRGLLLTGWGGLSRNESSDNIFYLDHAPHDWLFPRMAVVIHHGGAGTTAEGLRAGIPTIVTPFAFDQSFWGARIKEAGLGPEPIPQKRLTVDRLAQAIEVAIQDTDMRRRAASFGEALRLEDGVSNAVKVIQHYLGNP